MDIPDDSIKLRPFFVHKKQLSDASVARSLDDGYDIS